MKCKDKALGDYTEGFHESKIKICAITRLSGSDNIFNLIHLFDTV